MKYYIRLDDASEKRDIVLWDKMEKLLDEHNVKPLVGVIPNCEDPMMENYTFDKNFWDRVQQWSDKGWKIALHGYNHVCTTLEGGINPVNERSEFAGVPLDIQKEKIRKGVEIFRQYGINPKVFFAPSHTFDENTIVALGECSDIRIISDTVANKPYCKYGMTFIPQQSGRVRKLPFNTVTFCYHPNTMKEKDFVELEAFLKANRSMFSDFCAKETKRKFGVKDWFLKQLYFIRRK